MFPEGRLSEHDLPSEEGHLLELLSAEAQELEVANKSSVYVRSLGRIATDLKSDCRIRFEEANHIRHSCTSGSGHIQTVPIRAVEQQYSRRVVRWFGWWFGGRHCSDAPSQYEHNARLDVVGQ